MQKPSIEHSGATYIKSIDAILHKSMKKGPVVTTFDKYDIPTLM